MSIMGYDIAYGIIEHIESKGYLYFIEHVHDIKGNMNMNVHDDARRTI